MTTASEKLRESMQSFDEGGVLKLVGLGDSLTYGWMVGHGFFYRCCDMLTEAHPRGRLESVGAGVPGDTADGGLSRLTGLLDQNPDVVTVQFGLNDCFNGYSPQQIQANLERIARKVTEAQAVCILATSCPLQRESDQRLAEPVYEAIREAARATGAIMAELEHGWVDRVEKNPPTDTLYQADGVHPTDAGHDLMARSLFETFEAPFTGVA